MPYKVLTDLGEQGGQSAVMRYIACVLYTKDEWATAPSWLAKKGYYLTFFEHLEEAELFSHVEMFRSMAIWECEVDNILDELPQMCKLTIDDGTFAPSPTYYWPSGTKMAMRIKITRRIE